MIEPACVFEDRQSPDDRHVQWTDDDGGTEMAIFSGARARDQLRGTAVRGF
jgi:hypothetical protein